jgi:hypothetical protein
MFLLQRQDTLPLAKGFPDQSCEVTKGVMSILVQVLPKPCEDLLSEGTFHHVLHPTILCLVKTPLLLGD